MRSQGVELLRSIGAVCLVQLGSQKNMTWALETSRSRHRYWHLWPHKSPRRCCIG